MIITAVGCSNNKSNPAKWSDEEVNSWFEKKEWLAGWSVLPDESINKRNLAIHYFKNQKHWDQAFRFLQTADLKSLPDGKQELEGEHLFVAVSEYYGKQQEDARYEAHKKYIDIQYVIEGEELIGLTTHDKAEEVEPYNEEKDIAFYRSDEGKLLMANPDRFFVFFPEDVHQPSIIAGDSVLIKKAVVKVRIE